MKASVIFSAFLSVCMTGAVLAQEKLEYRPVEGTATEKSVVKLHQILTLGGQDVPTDVESQTVNRQTVGKRADDGTLRVETALDSMKIAISLPGGRSVAYDSTKPDTKNDDPQLAPLLDTWRAMRGLKYTYVLGKDNQPTAVEGLDKILAAAPATARDLRVQLEPKKLMTEFKQGLGVLPDGPVKKGDRWERTEINNIGGGQTLTFKTYYEYQGTVEKDGRTLDKIGVFHSAVTYAISADAPIPLKVISSDLKIEASMGTAFFDRQVGEVVETNSVTRITGPMLFDLNGMQLPGKLDLTIDTNSARQK